MTTYPSAKYSGGQACRGTPSKHGLRKPVLNGYKYPKRPKVNGKLTPFIPLLLLALEVDSRRPKRDRRTALMLFEAIKKDGYTGGYSILTDYVRNWRNGLILGSGKPAFVPLKFQLGEAFQFDWSEESLMIGGFHRKIQVAHYQVVREPGLLSFCLSNTNAGNAV